MSRPSRSWRARWEAARTRAGRGAAGLHRRASTETRAGRAIPAPPSATPPLPEIAFQDRMATVEFRVSGRPHITVDRDVCRSCTTKACVTACPANLFVPTVEGGILFNYEECFECGTCYLVCNREGAITWTYPDGGYGVAFRSA